jgi:hypothetical protein
MRVPGISILKYELKIQLPREATPRDKPTSPVRRSPVLMYRRLTPARLSNVNGFRFLRIIRRIPINPLKIKK